MHPKDSREIHVFRTYIDVRERFEEVHDEEKYLLADHSGFLILEDNSPDFEDEKISIRSQKPSEIRPEEKESSSFAGWPGNRLHIKPESDLELEFTFSAKDWYENEKTEVINLDEQLLREELWQEGWKNKLPP